MSKIPDRWLDYSNVGAVVEGTRFIAFKVPLSKNEDWNLKELKRQVPDLKLIIDLTNTKKYYHPRHCEELGLIHRKIFVPGHVVPNKKIVEEFFSAVTECPEPSLIGVHCTHGLNRTGYLVCRWMIEKAGLEPNIAITAFNKARGHEQERENYLEDLRTKAWETETGYKKWSQDKEAAGGRGSMDRYHWRKQIESQQGSHQDGSRSCKFYNDTKVIKLCKLNICYITEREICRGEVWIKDPPLLPALSRSGPSGVAEYRRKWTRRFSTSCS